jgi:hypothetical protein
LGVLVVLVAAAGAWLVVSAFAASGPTVSSFTLDAASPTKANSVSWRVVFSSSVTGVAASNFTLVQAGGVSGAGSISVSGSGTTWTVSASTGIGSGTLGLNLTSAGSIKDASNKTLQGVPYTGPVYTIDRTAPSVSSINRQAVAPNPTKAASLPFTVTFSEPVNTAAVIAARFAVATSNVTGTAPSVGTITPLSPSGGFATAYTVNVTTTSAVGANNGSVRLDLTSVGSIQDQVANALTGTRPGDQSYTFDTTAPTVSSIVRIPPAAGPTNAGSVSWTVTFSEPVVGVATGNFQLVASNLSGSPAVTGVSSGSGGLVWTVTASTGSGTPTGSGTLALKMSTAGSTIDLAGNGLTGLPTAAGPAFTIDKTPPTVTLLTWPPDPNTTATSTFTWSATDPGGSGVVSFLCSTENGAFAATVHSAGGSDQPCSSPLTYAVATTTNGQHQFAVEAVDAAGNVSQAVSYTWKVDKGSPQVFTIAGSVTGLVPGVWFSIPVTITNPNAETLYVTGLTVGASGTPGGCDSATNVQTLPSSAAPGNKLAVPANASNWPVPAGPFRPQIRLKNTAGNQDNCKSKTFSLSYAGSGTNQP